jgi:predicted O-methyltransferase YrrM
MSDEGRIGPVGPESRFSRPDHLCPHPEYWSSTDDHSTEIEVSEMLAGLVRGLQPEYVVETGSAWGQTSEAIGKALKANGHGRLVSLEVDQERVDYSRNRCAGLPVDCRKQASLDFVPEEEIQFAFFDSLFTLRVPEFNRYYTHMKKGAIVAFHDTHPGHGGGQFYDYNMDLRTAILQDLENKGFLKAIYMCTPRGIMIGEVM